MRIFNSSFEISLRVLLTLESNGNKPCTLDELTCLDFITVYGEVFGYSDRNIHGRNGFMFCEFTARRSQMENAINSLVLRNSLAVSKTEDGFSFYLTDLGIELSQRLNSEYAAQYRKISSTVSDALGGVPVSKQVKKINSMAIEAIKETSY